MHSNLSQSDVVTGGDSTLADNAIRELEEMGLPTGAITKNQLLKSFLKLSIFVYLLPCKRLESITSQLQPIFVPETTVMCLEEWLIETTRLASFSPL